MMKTLMMLLFLCHVASPVKYYVEGNHLLSSGFVNVHEYIMKEIVQGVVTFYYNNTMKREKVFHDWTREMIKNNTKEWDEFMKECKDYEHIFKTETANFNQNTSDTEGGHVIQQITYCEWDDETDQIDGDVRYGNDGEDFIAFDLKTETWTALDAQAENVKKKWDANEGRNRFLKNFVTKVLSAWLKIYLNYGRSYVNRKDLPSVSLLQKTPSSPVSCHATGFYPDRAQMFWSKDGEEIHEGVNHGNILPNHDESFQMSVDLEVSSIPSEEWTKYDCVFQLSGVQNVMMTKLDKDVIQSNYRKTGILDTEGNLSEISIAVIAVIVAFIVMIIAALGFTTLKKRNERPPTPSSDTVSL